ncbi:MAG: hypothetical protein ACLU0O_02245 [Collinsella sp.]
MPEKGATATFFSGDAAEASPATAKAIVDAGRGRPTATATIRSRARIAR